jgi:phosphoenolpyruvate carboxykinase (GTP)
LCLQRKPIHVQYRDCIAATNKHLIRWVEKMADLTQPDAIHWIDGSTRRTRCSAQLVKAGTFLR